MKAQSALSPLVNSLGKQLWQWRIRTSARWPSTMQIVLCCLLVFASGVVLAKPGSESTMADKIDDKEFVHDIEHAKALEKTGKPAEAIAFWIKHRDKYAGRGGHYENELGNFYLNSADFENAERTFLQGIALNARYPRLYIGLSLTYLAKNQFQDAQAWATRSVEEFPSWWLGYYALGQIHWKQDNYQLAKVWLEKSLSIQQQPVALWLYGIVSYEVGDWQTCVAALKAAVEADQTYLDDFQSVKVLAVALAQLGIYSEADEVINAYKARPNIRMDEAHKLEKLLNSIRQSAAKR